MKSILVGNKKRLHKCRFPFLGISEKGRVVLFTSVGVGTLVHSPISTDKIGNYCDVWSDDVFERLEGKITLSND